MAKLPAQVKKTAAANPNPMGVKSSKVEKKAKKDRKVEGVTAPKADRKPNTPIFGNNAPSAPLHMPQNADITAAELVAFLPNWLRSHDVVYRFAQNGMETAMLSIIINYHRKSTKGYATINNSICKVIQNAMRDSGCEGWTIKKHKAGEYRRENHVWNEDDLSLTGFELISEKSKRKRVSSPIENVSFASLANDLERYPDEATGDGLDLSRCVKYAVANAQHALQFPRDFDYLTQLTGGRSAARRMHWDNSVFSRWKLSKKEAVEKARNNQTGFKRQNYVFTTEQNADVLNYLSQFDTNPQPAPAANNVASQDVQDAAQSEEFDFDEFLKSLSSLPPMPAQLQSHGVGYRPAITSAPAPAEAPVLRRQVSWMDRFFTPDIGVSLPRGRVQQEQDTLGDESMNYLGRYMDHRELGNDFFRGFEANMNGQDNFNMQMYDQGSHMDSCSTFTNPPFITPSSASIDGPRLLDTAGPSTSFDWFDFDGSSNYGYYHQDLTGSFNDPPQVPRSDPYFLHPVRSGFENGYAGYQA